VIDGDIGTSSGGRRWPGGAGLAAALALSLLTGAPALAAGPAPSVGVVAVTRKVVALGGEYVGRVEAVQKVEIRARVEGMLLKRLFTEGSKVKAGDLLYVIEPDQYRAQLEQAKANLASAEANATNTAVQLRRARELLRNSNIAVATVDERQAQDSMARAATLQQKAAVQLAQLSLGYTEIRAPITGRIGRTKIDVGNLVNPSSGVLTTILSEDPIYVTFPISVSKLTEIVKEARARGQNAGDAIIRVRLPDGTLYDKTGKVDYVDNQVNPNTDTLLIRAIFPNPDRLLVDGQYATVIAEVEKPAPALVIPESALQADQDGMFALVVNKEKKVEVRRVKLRGTQDGDAVIDSGLAAGDLVIVQGIQKVRPGETVDATIIPPATKS
jgi:membrane fusion protein (multidrug efflux system)